MLGSSIQYIYSSLSQSCSTVCWNAASITGRASSSMFEGPVTGPWAKIVLAHLKKLEKSWKNWKISWKNWKQSWKNWKPSWKIGHYMEDLYTSLQRIKIYKESTRNINHMPHIYVSIYTQTIHKITYLSEFGFWFSRCSPQFFKHFQIPIF